ncbi:hypothetical protein COLO4_37765 [Corchorus olitorius]|uniref:Uncharacterized protein n=1 Tax=Corchorus olitorius TaxID=93759 RepID=A0A1R3FZM0_9ROSI|nr:hypothetical protein COLO4_37765 [Corchorus olitorius]
MAMVVTIAISIAVTTIPSSIMAIMALWPL